MKQALNQQENTNVTNVRIQSTSITPKKNFITVRQTKKTGIVLI